MGRWSADLEETIKDTTAHAYLKSIQDAAWLLLVILTPLWLNLWGQQPFELPKVMLVRTLVWLLAGLTFADVCLGRRSLWQSWRSNPLMGAVVLLALVLMVTTVTAVTPSLSLWGSYERSQGAVTLLTYLLLFLLAAEHFQDAPRAYRLLTALALTGVPLVLIGLGQAAGWNPFQLVSDARSPVFATLGRANFLGAYLAILTPLTAGLGRLAPQRRERLAWRVLLLAELVVIGLTLARGAWLATAVSLSLFVLLGWGWQLARGWRWLAWAGIGLLSLSGPLVILWHGQQQAGSTAARLAIWQGTLKLIGERPFLGYGADALGQLFPRVYPPELVYYQGRDFFVDRAHNLFLDWTVTAGVAGLLAFSLLLFSFLFTMHQALRRPQFPEKRVLFGAVVSAVVANVVNNLVSFDVTPTATATWLLMGLGIGVTRPLTVPAVVVAKRPFGRWVLVAVLVLGWGTAVWQGNVRPLGADVAARQAYRLAQMGDLALATAAAEQAVALWPVEPAHYLLMSQTYWQQAVADPAAAPTWLARAEAVLENALQGRPEDAFLWLQLAELKTAAFWQFGYGTSVLANDAYEQALKLAPNHAVVYVAWGRARLADGDVAAAASLLRQAVQLDASSGEAYLYLGAAELALGRLDIALADYREAVRLRPESAEAYAGLATSYWQLDKPEAARQAAAKALQHDPQNEQATAVLQAMQRFP